MQLKHNINQDAPLGMTTFSPARESHSQIPPINAAKDTGAFPASKGMSDIGRRLFSLADKTGCKNLSQYEGQDWTFEALKDLIYDIDEKVQQLQKVR